MTQRFKKNSLIAACVLGIAGIIYYFDLHHYISLEGIKERSEQLIGSVERHYHSSVLVYMAVLALSVIVCIPSTIPLVLLGGYLFGTFFGAVYSTTATTIGSTVSFLMFRYWIRELLTERYRDTINYFKKKIEAYGMGYLLALHYSSLVPFFIINMIAAVTDISLASFIMISMAGSFPVFFIYAFAGRKLSEIQTAGDIFSPSVVMAMALLICMAAVPMIIRKVKARRQR